jgi:hypothetical protein
MNQAYRKIEAWGVVVLSGLLFVAMIVMGWMMFVDGTIWRPVITYDNSLLETDKTIYAPGDLVYAKVEFYKSRDLVGEQKWNLVNGRVFAYASRKVSIPSGVTEKWMLIEKLPHCEKGEYHFEGLSTYQVNPLRSISYKLKTRPFMILPEAPEASEPLKENQG